MALIGATGFDMGDPRVEPWPTAGSYAAGTPTYDTAIKRTGSGSLKIDASAAACTLRLGGSGGATTVTTYNRAYIYFDALPSSGAPAFMLRPNGVALQVLSTGAIRVLFNGVQLFNSAAGVVTTGTWYCFEFSQMVNTTASATDACEVRLDGVSLFSESGTDRSTVASTNLDFGPSASGNGLIFHVDDLVVFDNAGATNNTWVGEGAVTPLNPTADGGGSSANWKKPVSASTTNRYTSIDNKPPVGTTDALSTAETQLRNATSNAATVYYEATCQSYDAASVPSADTILAVMGVARLARDGTAPTTFNMRLLSNPDSGADLTTSAPAVLAEITTSGWTSFRQTVEAPTVTRGTAVVVRVGRGGANARIALIDAMLVYVVHQELPAVTGTSAQTLPSLTQAASGALAVSGSGAQTLPNLSQAAAAAAKASGTAAQTLPSLTQDADGSVTEATPTGSAAQTLPALTQSASGAAEVTAAAAQTLPALSQAATGALETSAAAAQTLPALTQTASGALEASASAASVLPSLSQAASGTAEASGSAAQTLPALDQDAVAAAEVSGSAAQGLPSLSQSATGAAQVAGAAAQTLGALDQLAFGLVGDVIGGAALQTLPALDQDAVGSVAAEGASAAVLEAVISAATAELVVATEGASLLPALEQAAAGAVAEVAVGAIAQTLPALVTAASGESAGDVAEPPWFVSRNDLTARPMMSDIDLSR